MRPLAHREQDLLAVGARGVLRGLADPAELDAELGQRRRPCGALKCSAQLAYGLPGGAGTAVSGLPMCSAHDGSTPAGTLRNRS